MKLFYRKAFTYSLVLLSVSGCSAPSIPSILDTLDSMYPNTSGLQSAFNKQNTKIAQGLAHDCPVFDANNICVAIVGTRSDADVSLDGTSGVLILSHKSSANFRFGGYVDQSFSETDLKGLKLKRGSPGYGVFGAWSENPDGSGLQIRGSASFGKVSMESTRTAIPSTTPGPSPFGTPDAEAGFGKSDIESNGFQAEASREYAVNALWAARPYVGYRQVSNRREGYTETDAVDYPLAYSNIKQSTQLLLAGVRFARTISPQTTMTIAAGLEHDIEFRSDRYTASYEGGSLDTGDMKDSLKDTRPVVSVILNHDINKAQRIGFSVNHRKEALQSESTTTGMIQYSRGF